MRHKHMLKVNTELHKQNTVNQFANFCHCRKMHQTFQTFGVLIWGIKLFVNFETSANLQK